VVEERWHWLADAIFEYVTDAEWEVVVSKFPGDDTALEDLKKRQNAGQTQSARDLFRAAMAVGKNWSDAGSRKFELFRILCDKAISGNLVARGIQTKPEVGHQPILVASRFFLSPKWDGKNKIENAGHCFELVEICRRRSTRVAEATSHSNPNQKIVKNQDRKYSGRKSHADEIRSVVIRRIKDGTFRSNTHQDEKATKILKELGYDTENPPAGYSIATIKRVFREEWENQN